MGGSRGFRLKGGINDSLDALGGDRDTTATAWSDMGEGIDATLLKALAHSITVGRLVFSSVAMRLLDSPEAPMSTILARRTMLCGVFWARTQASRIRCWSGVNAIGSAGFHMQTV